MAEYSSQVKVHDHINSMALLMCDSGKDIKQVIHSHHQRSMCTSEGGQYIKHINRYQLTVNILVKHPRSGLPPTVLYKSSYLQAQLYCIVSAIIYNVHGLMTCPPRQLTEFAK